MKISAVVRARNCARDLETCLASLKSQELPGSQSVELIVVDNDSTDATADVARAAGARVVPMPSAAFSWGRALNAGIAAATGEVVILLSADAEAADPEFARRMIAPFLDERVAAVYGRQVPRKDAPIEEVWRLARTFDSQRRVYDASTQAGADGRGMVVSNACAAIRRRVWQSLAYDEHIEGGEEGIWTRTVISRGLKAVYEPAARAYHSHNDPVFRSAIRGVELFIKNRKLRDRSPSVPALVHWMAVNMKRRVHMCCSPGMNTGRRLTGLLRIPVDVAAGIVAYATLRTAPQGRLRSALWDLRLSA